MHYIVLPILIAFAALFSGLTLGLMGLDVHDLRRKAELGDASAAKVYSVRKKGNQLLATLLLANIGVNAAIALVFGELTSGLWAGVISTFIIFIFGEVIPQAVVSRNAMAFGVATAPFVKVLMIAFHPICRPVAYVLDFVLGEELPSFYSKNEIARIITEHGDHPSAPIDADEERIVLGALKFSETKVSDVLTPETVVTFVKLDDLLDEAMLEVLKSTGRSRFPVVDDEGEVVGILYAKDFIGFPFDGAFSVADKMRPGVIVVQGSDRLDIVLNKFLDSKKHLFTVDDDFGVLLGIVTIEDVIEEILKREIVDENDEHADMRQFAKAMHEKEAGEKK